MERLFIVVPLDELKATVEKMCEELGIHTSGANYNIFHAVFLEQEKAHEGLHKYDAIEKEE